MLHRSSPSWCSLPSISSSSTRSIAHFSGKPDTAELGSALNANEQLFTLVDPATIWGLAYIDEARAGAIEIGQPAKVIRRSAPDRAMTAKVVRIEIESDRVNEEYRVYVRCGGCPLALHIREQAEVLITVAQLPSARLVKVSSLVDIKGRQATAWTVEGGRSWR